MMKQHTGDRSKKNKETNSKESALFQRQQNRLKYLTSHTKPVSWICIPSMPLIGGGLFNKMNFSTNEERAS